MVLTRRRTSQRSFVSRLDKSLAPMPSYRNATNLTQCNIRGGRLSSGGIAVAVAFVLVFVAWYGRIIASHLADGDPSCAFGPRGTTCSPASFPSDQARH